jgi:hypothetical protein
LAGDFLQLSHRPEGGKPASYSNFVMLTLLMVMDSVGR